MNISIIELNTVDVTGKSGGSTLLQTTYGPLLVHISCASVSVNGVKKDFKCQDPLVDAISMEKINYEKILIPIVIDIIGLRLSFACVCIRYDGINKLPTFVECVAVRNGNLTIINIKYDYNI